MPADPVMPPEKGTSTSNGEDSGRGPWLVLAGVAVLAAVAVVWSLRESGLARYWRAEMPSSSSPSLRSVPQPAPTASAPRAGDRPAGVAVVLRDGQTLISVDRAGKVQGVYDRSPETMTLVATVLLDGVLPPPASAQALGPPPPSAPAPGSTSTSRSPSTPTPPRALADLIVRDVRPTLRWRPQPSPTSYRVAIADESGAAIVSSPAVGGTSWQSTVSLQPGHAYSWRVTPQDGEALPAVRFRVIDAESARALDARLARAGRSNLLRGLALLQAGVLDEAEQAFVGLAADNDGSERVLKLLDQVRARRTPH